MSGLNTSFFFFSFFFFTSITHAHLFGMVHSWPEDPHPRDRPRGRPKRKDRIRRTKERTKEKTRNPSIPILVQSSSSSSSSSSCGSRIRLKNSSPRSHSSLSPTLPPSFGTGTIHLLSSKSSHVLHSDREPHRTAAATPSGLTCL